MIYNPFRIASIDVLYLSKSTFRMVMFAFLQFICNWFFPGNCPVPIRWEKLQAWAAKSRNCCSLISSSRTWSQTSNIERQPVRSRWVNPQATFHASTYFYKHLQTSKGTCRKARELRAFFCRIKSFLILISSLALRSARYLSDWS